jgi:hypothetical protein
MKRILLIVSLVVSLFSGCGASSDTPQEIIKSYFKAALDGELNKANSYFSKNASDFAKKSIYKKINGFNNFVEDNSKFEIEFETTIDNKNNKQILVFLKNDTATSSYLKEHNFTTRFNKVQKTSNLRFQFVYENNSWKISTAG